MYLHTAETLPQDSGTLLQLTLSEKKQVYLRTSMYKLTRFISFLASITSFIRTSSCP